MSTEYTFDGLDEWEKNLAQVIDQQYPEEFKQRLFYFASMETAIEERRKLFAFEGNGGASDK